MNFSMNNLTEFEMATGLARIALDEFLSHEISNITGLLTNYWNIVENEIAGNGNGRPRPSSVTFQELIE